MVRRLRSVAITTNTLGVGGAEKQRVLLANELNALGVSATLYCLQARGELEALVDAGVAVVDCSPFRGLIGAHDAVISGTTNTEVVFAARGRLAGRFPSWHIAVHNPQGEAAPMVSSLVHASLWAADGVIALSQWHSDAILSAWGKAPTAIVANGISLNGYDGVRALRVQGGFDYDVGYIGRLSAWHKGLDRLLAALADPALAGVKIGIAGVGPDRASLERCATELGLGERITWLGAAHAPTFLSQTRLIVLLSRFEAQPMVLLEARAAGVPVVASSTAGLDPENDDRLVEDADDPTSVARAIAQVAKSDVRSQEYTQPASAREMAANYIAYLEKSSLRSRPMTVLGFAQGALRAGMSRLREIRTDRSGKSV